MPLQSFFVTDDCSSVKDIGRASIIDDVVDFVCDFWTSDLLGMVSKRHLICKLNCPCLDKDKGMLTVDNAGADQDPEGTESQRCLMLSKLHSDAVDFPKVSHLAQ